MSALISELYTTNSNFPCVEFNHVSASSAQVETSVAAFGLSAIAKIVQYWNRIGLGDQQVCINLFSSDQIHNILYVHIHQQTFLNQIFVLLISTF